MFFYTRLKVDAMEAEVDVMKEVLVETESEKETIEARNKDLMSQLDLLVDDQVKIAERLLGNCQRNIDRLYYKVLGKG